MKRIAFILILTISGICHANAQTRASSDPVKMIKELAEIEHEIAILEKKKQDIKIDSLEATLSELRMQIPALRKDTADLALKIAQLDSQIADMNSDLSELKDIRSSVSSKFIEEHRPYLDTPLSSISLEKLESIREEGRQYSDDANIKSFIEACSNCVRNKRIYDAAVALANTRYDKAKVKASLAELESIRNSSETQRAELSQIRRSLANYEKGILAFREFIVSLNRQREGMSSYSQTDLDEDWKRIYTPEIERNINEYLKPVPFLNKEFEAYLKTIRQTPSKHPAIEEQILNFNL